MIESKFLIFKNKKLLRKFKQILIFRNNNGIKI